MVSVVMPVYNSEKYLNESIDSVLNQTYKNIELIVIDDGSTDNSSTIVNQYANRLVYIKQDNKGVAAARNAGIAVSKGTYIAFIDSDDIWDKKKVEIQREILDRNPNIGLVYSDHATFDDNGIIFRNVAKGRGMSRPSGDIFFDLILCCLFQTSTVMVRRGLLEKVGLFNVDYRSGEDYDLWLRIASCSEVAYAPHVLAMYRQHPLSITNKKPEDSKENYEMPMEIIVIEKNLLASKKQFPAQFSRKVNFRISEIFFSRAYGEFYRDNNYLALRYFVNSIKKTPWRAKAYYYILACILPNVLKPLFVLLKTLKRGEVK